MASFVAFTAVLIGFAVPGQIDIDRIEYVVVGVEDFAVPSISTIVGEDDAETFVFGRRVHDGFYVVVHAGVRIFRTLLDELVERYDVAMCYGVVQVRLELLELQHVKYGTGLLVVHEVPFSSGLCFIVLYA